LRKKFAIYKLRTLENGIVTKRGSFLWKYKINKLPQILNIIKGDISFVGSRPGLPTYCDLLEDKEVGILKLKAELARLLTIK